MGAIALHHAPDPSGGSERVHSMLAAAPHRGAQREVVTVGQTTFGVSANDRRDAWLAGTGTHAAVVTGCLDNADELHRELGSDDPSPAAVVLAAFAAWGDGALGRFRGSFAGAISDGVTLRCFRDQFGSRPLYYRTDGDDVVVATECKQVNAGGLRPAQADLDLIARGFFGDMTEEETSFAGVRRLPRAHELTADRSGVRTRRYWDPTDLLETSTLSQAEISERLHELLVQAVERTLTGNDVILLSGGVDSPTIAALAAEPHRQIAGRRLTALSAVYPDHPSVDESEYIKLVADDLDLDLHTFVTGASAYDDTQHWVDVLDGPVTTVAIPEVAEAYRLAAGLGGGTVLTGELEEYVFEISHYLVDHLVANRRWGAVSEHVRQLRGKGRPWRKIAGALAKPLVPPRLAVAYVGRYRDGLPMTPPWIDRTRLDELGLYADLRRPAGQRWGLGQTAPLLGHVNSFETDEIVAAYCGVDVRRPFGDIDLWSFVLSLPAERKWPELRPKALLREVMRGQVPDPILDRRDKTYFDAAALDAVEYPALRKWIFERGERIPGVDYATLATRLEDEDMSFSEVQWATDLMYVHAFISRWA